jgi:hypothetical protein
VSWGIGMGTVMVEGGGREEVEGLQI